MEKGTGNTLGIRPRERNNAGTHLQERGKIKLGMEKEEDAAKVFAFIQLFNTEKSLLYLKHGAK